MAVGFLVLLERVTATRGDELEQIPDDEEVKKADRIQEIKVGSFLSASTCLRTKNLIFFASWCFHNLPSIYAKC
jgi:hypothetical protein